MSEIYGITVNEILGARRLSGEEYRCAAEDNLCSVISDTFSLGDRVKYFRRKWRKDHLTGDIFVYLVSAASIAAGIVLSAAGSVASGLISAAVWNIIRRNRIMANVEQRAFGNTVDSCGSDTQNKKDHFA